MPEFCRDGLESNDRRASGNARHHSGNAVGAYSASTVQGVLMITPHEAAYERELDLIDELEERAAVLLYEPDSDCHDFAAALMSAAGLIIEEGRDRGRWDDDSWDDRDEMRVVKRLASTLATNALDAHPEWLVDRAVRAVELGTASYPLDGLRAALSGPDKYRTRTQQDAMRIAEARGLIASGQELWGEDERGAA